MLSQGTPECFETETSTGCDPRVKIGHRNAQSLLGLLGDMKGLMTERNLDILCISDTCLHVDMPMISAFISIPKFSVYICDAGRGKGICMCVGVPLKTHEIFAATAKSTDVEDSWVTVHSKMLPSLIEGAAIGVFVVPLNILIILKKVFFNR